jgi:nucleoside-diphosphate-sugar epimerase
MNVLVTGSSGAIGRPVCAELARQGDVVRGFDRVQADEPHEMFLGQIEHPNHVRQAMRGVDAVIHLAANPYDAPFPELIGPNVLGLFNVLDAARAEGVRRVVLASSVQVVGKRNDRRIKAEHRSPNNHYAVTKVLAEEMGAMYSQRFGLEVIAARIGWMVRDEREARRMLELGLFHIYVSRADIARFFYLSVHSEFNGFAVLWAMGADGRDRFDLEPAQRAIGYEPQELWPQGLPFPLPRASNAPS